MLCVLQTLENRKHFSNGFQCIESYQAQSATFSHDNIYFLEEDAVTVHPANGSALEVAVMLSQSLIYLVCKS